MKTLLLLSLFVLASLGFAALQSVKSIYDFKMKDIDGKEVSLGKYKGKVLIVVNVASQCGLTPQYEGLQKLYDQKKEAGLIVLGFPANEFGAQEPGTDAEIKEFCTGNYKVTFPMFSKIVVKGEGTHPLYQHLIKEASYHEDVEWNFAKFIVNREGKVVARFHPRTKPDDPKFLEALQAALASK